MAAVLFTLLTVLAVSSVVDFIPKDSMVVFVSRDNARNYEEMKSVGVFGFLMRDLGIEGLISQQVETMKYVDPQFDPANFWALIDGDIGFFAKGEADLSLLEELAQIDEMDLMMGDVDPFWLFEIFGEYVDSCLIIKPTVSPDLVLDAMNRLLGMDIVFGEPIMGMDLTILKEGEYILVPSNETAYIASMQARNQSIRQDPIFSQLWSQPNWMIFYLPKGFAADDLTEMMQDLFPFEMMEQAATMEYAWMTGAIENKSLIFKGFNKYDYHDPALKSIMLDAAVDLKEWSKEIRSPGALVGGMKFNHPERLMDYYRQSFKSVFDMIKYEFGLGEEEEQMIHEIADLLMTLSGEFIMSADLVMKDFIDFGVDFHFLAGVKDRAYVKSFVEESFGFGWSRAYGIEFMRLEDEMPTYLVLSDLGVALTSFSPEKYLDIATGATPLYNRSGFKRLIDQYGYSKGYSLTFLDIGELMTSLLGLPFPAAMLSQIGIDADGNAQFMMVVQ